MARMLPYHHHKCGSRASPRADALSHEADLSANQEVRDRIKKLIVEGLHLEGLTPEAIGDDDALFGDAFGLDSIDALELVVGLEKEFKITIESDEAGKETFASVSTLAELVQKKLAADDGPGR